TAPHSKPQLRDLFRSVAGTSRQRILRGETHMTTHPLRRLSGSVLAGVCALAIAAGCSENQNPVKPDGPDVTPVPPSPLCGATNQNTRAGGGVGVAGMPALGIRRSS